MKPVVTLPSDLCRACRVYGHLRVQNYEQHRTYRGAEGNPVLQGHARMAECAACLWAGGDPLKALAWLPYRRGDGGYDVVAYGARLDIKSTAPHGRYLLWPRCKIKEFARADFHALVLVTVAPPRCILVGWIEKDRFAAERRVAPRGHRLDPGTWFVADSDLRPMETLAWGWW